MRECGRIQHIGNDRAAHERKYAANVGNNTITKNEAEHEKRVEGHIF